jgi:DNA-binding transcriptional regulator YdaS (Cro superfamily)
MTIQDANKYLYHGDKSRIARRFGASSQDVYMVATGRRKGKFGRAKEIAEEIIRVAEQNIAEGFVAPKSSEQ